MRIRIACLGRLPSLRLPERLRLTPSATCRPPSTQTAAMKMMKSDADYKAAWDAMSTDKQGAMKKECNDAAPSKPHAEFCVKMHLLGGNS